MNASYRSRAGLASVLLVLAWAPGARAGSDFYQQRNLVSNSAAVRAENHDPRLAAPWGVAFNPFGFAWVSANGSGVSTLYDGDGKAQTLAVTVPPAGAGGTGNPAAIVSYGGPGFAVTKGAVSGPSRFLFASEDGGIAGWASNVDFTNAVRMVDNGAPANALYTGLAVGADGQRPLLYAADFRNARIDVFDSAFKPVALPGKPFHEPRIPPGYAPFGLQAINGDIYVSYAHQDAQRRAPVAGRGLGFVSIFSPAGQLVRRLASQGVLNAPWGMALAPASFGKFSDRLLVANAGDGTINAYSIASGRFVGRLKGIDRKPLRIDGLRGIAFGNGLSNQPIDTLFFSAAPGAEKHGLYGRLDVAPGDAYDDSEDAE